MFRGILYTVFIIGGLMVLFLIKFSERGVTGVLRSSFTQSNSVFGSSKFRKPKIILSWTDYFGVRTPPNFLFSCPDLTYKCIMHSDRDRLSEADAVLFHTQDIKQELKKIISLPRNTEQYFVYYSLESPTNAHIKPGKVPGNFFNWTATYLPSSDIQSTYMAKGWIKREDAEKKGILFTTPILNTTQINKKRKRALFGAISNCHTTVKRSEFIGKVTGLINNILITGSCSLTAEGRNLCPRKKNDTVACFRAHAEDSYFLFGLENSICNGYITEKYWDRIHMNTVLILWSRSVFNKIEIPPKSAIFVDDYKSIREFTDHLKYLMTNQTAYAEYFEWRKDYTWEVTESMECGICRRLLAEEHKPIEEKRKMYPDVMTWFQNMSQCQGPLTSKMVW